MDEAARNSPDWRSRAAPQLLHNGLGVGTLINAYEEIDDVSARHRELFYSLWRISSHVS